MAKTKKLKPNKALTQEWHDGVIDDTPNETFIPKAKRVKAPEEPIYEDAPVQVKPVTNGKAQEPLQYYQWVDDHTLLSEVTKINKEYRGAGANKRWVNVFYGPLK